MDHSNNGDKGHDKARAGDEGNSSDQTDSVFWHLVKFVAASGLLTALVFWPYTFGPMAGMWEPDVVTDVGTVQKIQFVGGIWISTQIDTETRTFLVWDTVNLPKGTPLQTRQSYFGRQVCVANTPKCWGASQR